MELLKLLSANEMVAQVLSFLILLFLLRAFAWKRLLAVLDARRDRIASEFKAIEAGKVDIENIKLDYESKMRSIEDIAKERLREAAVEGKRMQEEMKKDAREEAMKILDNARVDVKLELAKTKEELKDEVVDIVLKTTERLIESTITEKQDRRVVEDFLERLDEAK